MEDKASFFARIRPVLAPSDFTRVRGAYYLAKHGHRAQKRKELGPDGKPLRYFEHVRRVAIILMDVAGCYDPDLIITCLLHDAVEDTEDIDGPIIELFFGSTVARRVLCLSKVPKEGYLERLKRADVETVLCKACDRLDNLRSLKVLNNPEFTERQVRETQEDLMPLFRDRLSDYTPLAKPCSGKYYALLQAIHTLAFPEDCE